MSDRARIERLLWRAGVGPQRGEVAAWEARGVEALISALLAPSGAPREPRPVRLIDGRRLDPLNEGDHDVLWWLDRAVRSRHPLVERMTLNWHDHFAVSNDSVGDNLLMLRYANTLRRHALGNFRTLVRAMVREPAMQLFLDLAYSTKDAPNENFARELMELFTLGVNNGYSEQDIREAARALTGYWWDYDRRRGGYDRSAHDAGVKTIFGRRGRFTPLEVVDLAIAHDAHAPYLCRKLWGYLSPRDCPEDLLAAMVAEYRRTGTEIAPVLGLALHHEAFWADLETPDAIKPPVVYVAGLLRATGQPVRRGDWAYLLHGMGQRPFYPPNVSGWPSGTDWLSTATVQVRYQAAAAAIAKLPLDRGDGDDLAVVQEHLGQPWASPNTLARLANLAASTSTDRSQRRRLLAQALLGGPDAQVC